MSPIDLPACINAKLTRYFEQLDGEQASGVHKMVVNEVEPVVIKFVLDLVNNNQSKASRILGINRGTLTKKIQLYKL
ncbi:helix-turn-helix domain-containing protein [Candidatus Thioglobus sp.]|uniref:helix-turn-helix domain-containing protein n=1 Tax=Candidatus Thioglobus sp. TaxID=2026721 RepID=UPI003D0EED2E